MQGFETMDESFMDQPAYCDKLLPQCVIMETKWICNWFDKVMTKASQFKDSGRTDTILFTDRSPYSAIAYCDDGKSIESMINAYVDELRELLGIEIYTVVIKVEENKLWSRIQDRLKREPERAQYKEDSRAWMQQISQFYESSNKWNFCVDNSSEDDGMKSLVSRVLRIVEEKIIKMPENPTVVNPDHRRIVFQPEERVWLQNQEDKLNAKSSATSPKSKMIPAELKPESALSQFETVRTII